MLCQLGYHINRRTGEVHRPDCSHSAEVNCRPLPACINSFDMALDFATRNYPRADACGHCAEEEIRESDARIFR